MNPQQVVSSLGLDPAGEERRLNRPERAFHEASRVFRDDGKASRWLTVPIISLDGKTSIEYLGDEAVLEHALETVAPIEHDMFAELGLPAK